MRSSLERQQSDLSDLTKRHIDLARALASGKSDRMVATLRDHYVS